MTTTETSATDSTRAGQPAPSDPEASGGHWLGRFIRPDLGDAAGYDARHHDFAWQNRHLARLMSNECPIPPDESLIQAAVSAMTEGNLYPHSGWELRDAVAAFAGVDPSQIVLGNGSTEILDVATRLFITPGDEAVIPVPTYGFYETQVRLNGGRPILVPATADLGFNVPDVLAAIGPRTKLIFISSPNNPIGRSWTVEEIESLLATGIPTVIDQAYLACGSRSASASSRHASGWQPSVTLRSSNDDERSSAPSAIVCSPLLPTCPGSSHGRRRRTSSRSMSPQPAVRAPSTWTKRGPRTCSCGGWPLTASTVSTSA